MRFIQVSRTKWFSFPAAPAASANSIVRHFAEQGCKVGFVDIADDAARALIADIGPKARLHYEHCDVTDIAALQRAIDAVRKRSARSPSW